MKFNENVVVEQFIEFCTYRIETAMFSIARLLGIADVIICMFTVIHIEESSCIEIIKILNYTLCILGRSS